MEHTVTASPATAFVHTTPDEANGPGISWAAVLAGGFVAAALSLALLALGSGLGLSSVSPWANDGVSARTIGVAAIVWLILMQAARVRGYHSIAQRRGPSRASRQAGRKAAARLSFVTFLSLLIGAFCASIAATWGGRHRDLPGV